MCEPLLLTSQNLYYQLVKVFFTVKGNIQETPKAEDNDDHMLLKILLWMSKWLAGPSYHLHM